MQKKSGRFLLKSSLRRTHHLFNHGTPSSDAAPLPDIRSVITMEMNRLNTTSPKTPLQASAPLTQKPKPEPNAPQFMQALAEAVETVTSKTLPSEPGTLSRLVKPRSHLDLVSLNPVQTRYVPASAALEKVGNSRLVPFVAGA